MNVDTAKLKIMLANDMGANLEDRMDGERKAQHELSGAAAALKQAAQKVPRDLSAHVDRALVEDEIKDGLEALQVVTLIKKYLTRAGDYLEHLGDVELQKAVAQGGRVAGMQSAMDLVKQQRDDEITKIQKFLAMAEAAERGEEPVIRTAAQAAREAHGSIAERKAAAKLEAKSVDDMTEEELDLYLSQE